MKQGDTLIVRALSLSHTPEELDLFGLELIRSGERKRQGLVAELERQVSLGDLVPDWVNRPWGQE
jgi:hypothetical protein